MSSYPPEFRLRVLREVLEEKTHAALMDAFLNPMSSPERGPMPRDLMRFLHLVGDPGGGLGGQVSDPRTPHGSLQQWWRP